MSSRNIEQKKHLNNGVSSQENFYHKESQRFSWIRKPWPKQFWASIKKIRSPDKDGQECVELSVFFSQPFKDLLNCPVPNNTVKQFIRYVTDSLELLETIAQNVSVNKPISSDELKEIIRHIKTGKSSYLDEIPNEALKFGF